MAGNRVPGTLGSSPSTIDTGTLCRSQSPSPGPLGVGPLCIDRSLLSEAHRTGFRHTICEALRRGGRDLDLFLLRAKYLVASSRAAAVEGVGSLASGLLELESAWAGLVIDQERRSFSLFLDAELARIQQIVGEGRLIADRDDYQYRVRPLYHSEGYTDPASFLEKLVAYRLLGKEPVWLHRDMVDKLERVAPILNRWSPGLAASVAREFRSLLGIQIRTIAGKESLSNHAFGLAIDIDAYSNPHVVNRTVIDVLNDVVRQGHASFDFGKVVLPESERGHKEYTADDIMEVSNLGQGASNAVREWLRIHLPRYRRLIADVQSGEKTLGLTHVASTTKLEDRSLRARAARERLSNKRPLSASETDAAERINRALGAIAADEDLRRIQVLYENIGDTRYIDTWMERGILTVPLYLVVVLVAELKLRWGEQYESSKDAMHFELVGRGGGPHIPPDAPLAHGEKHRTLARLMAAYAQSPRDWRLGPPTLLQRKPQRGAGGSR